MKHTPIIKARKTSRAKLVRTLDKLVSEYIRHRDKTCVLSHSGKCSGILNNGHLFSRTAYSTRFDTQEDGNCHAICYGHNFRHEFDPYPYMNWYSERFGVRALDELHRRYNTPVKLKDSDLKQKIEELEGLVK